MAKDFNVYKWRRNQLNENQIFDDENLSFKEEFDRFMDTNPGPGEIWDWFSIHFKDKEGKPAHMSLNEDGDTVG